MSYVNINDFDSNGFYRLGKAGYGGDSSDVSNQLQSGVTDIFSTVGAFAALKSDGSVVTWGGVEGIVSPDPWYIDNSFNIAFIDGRYMGIGRYNPPPYAPTNTTLLDISANVNIQGKLVADDISSAYIRSISTQWTTRPFGVITYTSGNVGIGKTNPQSALDVTGSSRISGSLIVDDTTLFVNGTDNIVGIGTSTPQATLDISGQMRCSGDFAVNSSVLFVDTNLKRVGIGDSSPQYVLDVSGSALFRNTNNAYTSSRIANIARITQAQLGSENVVRLTNTGTAIQFSALPSVTTLGVYSNTLTLYTFDAHVFFSSIAFTIDVFSGSFATSSNDISSSLVLVDKNNAVLYQYSWVKTSPAFSVVSVPSATLDTFTYERFPIRLQYSYRVDYKSFDIPYLINTLDVNTTYQTNALFVQGNTALVNGNITVGKTTSSIVNPPTVDISGNLAMTQNLTVNDTDIVVNTVTRNVGIGRNPDASCILDISTNRTGTAIRAINAGLGNGQTFGLGIGRSATATNMFRAQYEHIGNDSSANRLLIGTIDISNILSIGANRNIGIGLQDRVSFSRLSLGNLSHARSVAVYEDAAGDRFFGMGATYSSTGDVSSILHFHARTSDASSVVGSRGQMMLTADGNVGIGTITRPITRRLVLGNPSATTGAYIEFNNHAVTAGADTSVYKNYAIGSSLTDNSGSAQQLQFVYTGTPATSTSTNTVLMALNSQGYLGLGIDPTTNLVDVSGTAPIRFNTATQMVVRSHSGTAANTITVDTASGSVGINKNTPVRTLDVDGTAHVSGLVNISGDLIVDDTTFRVNTATKRVGVGKSSPQYSLDISGSTAVSVTDACSNILDANYLSGLIVTNTEPSGGSMIRLINDTNTQSISIGLGGSQNGQFLYNGAFLRSAAVLNSTGGWCIGTTSNTAAIRFYTNGAERMRIDSGGNVGIGVVSTGAISKGKMVVEGFQNYPSGTQIRATSYNLGGSTASIDVASGSVPLSLYCSDNIACKIMVVFSDERIKTDIESIPEESSVAVIDQLRPVFFNYIDPVKRNGEHRTSGFIAQEVKKVLPSAVSYTQDTIPDLLGFVEVVGNTVRMVERDGGHSFVTGDTIVLYGANGNKVNMEKRIEIRIVSVDGDGDGDSGTFTVGSDNDHPDDGVYFAYGRVVSDYHVIDNGTILTHCVSAVQSVLHTQRTMRQEIDELRQMVLAMRDSIL